MFNNFILYRILGNDLPPRHKIGQTLENLQFILEYESSLLGCEKRWVINRIVNDKQEKAIIALLEDYNQKYIYIPFIKQEYSAIEFDFQCFSQSDYFRSEEYQRLSPEMQARAIDRTYHNKILYAMNINGSKNAALKEGRSLARWVMPWDGNSFLTERAWEQIREKAKNHEQIKYLIVPMTRVLNNKDLLKANFKPNPIEEPQIIFRQDASEEFNETLRYGHFNKIELLWRLRVPGYWDTWQWDSWDDLDCQESPEAGQFMSVGWVARLFSGVEKCERDPYHRANKRRQGIRDFLDTIDDHLGMKKLFER